MMDWISDGLKSLLLMEEAFATQNFASFGRYSSHGIARVPWNSYSKVSAWKLPTFKSTRSVVLRKMLARQIASASPINVTRPSSTWLTSYPRSRISFFITASRPKWHGTINSNVFNLIFSVLMYRAAAHVTVQYPHTCRNNLPRSFPSDAWQLTSKNPF